MFKRTVIIFDKYQKYFTKNDTSFTIISDKNVEQIIPTAVTNKTKVSFFWNFNKKMQLCGTTNVFYVS